MKDSLKLLIENIYKYFFREDLLKPIIEVKPSEPVVVKSNREKWLDIAVKAYGIDPTPNDEVDDTVSCVFSLTTLIKRFMPDFPIMTNTPEFVKYIRTDKRFKPSNELKQGNIIVSVTGTGNGSIIGHIGIVWKDGTILSNSSATGLWSDKFNTISWIDRYSRRGGLDLFIFELL